MKSILLNATVVFLISALFGLFSPAPARALDLGALNIEFEASDTEVADVEMALRIAGKEALGVGACSPYAWSMKVNTIRFADLFSICGLLSGDISEDDASARVSVGVSLVNISGIRTFIGFDPINGGSSRGIGVSASGVHDFFGR